MPAPSRTMAASEARASATRAASFETAGCAGLLRMRIDDLMVSCPPAAPTHSGRKSLLQFGDEVDCRRGAPSRTMAASEARASATRAAGGATGAHFGLMLRRAKAGQKRSAPAHSTRRRAQPPLRTGVTLRQQAKARCRFEETSFPAGVLISPDSIQPRPRYVGVDRRRPASPGHRATFRLSKGADAGSIGAARLARGAIVPASCLRGRNCAKNCRRRHHSYRCLCEHMILLAVQPRNHERGTVPNLRWRNPGQLAFGLKPIGLWDYAMALCSKSDNSSNGGKWFFR
jgi:hypothetical protein